MTKFSLGDVRITTRVREDFLGEAFFSTLHEAGHALYEQGIDTAHEGTPLGEGPPRGSMRASLAPGRTWSGAAVVSGNLSIPGSRRNFRISCRALRLIASTRAINKVERSLIRTDADEVTYNLHVMLRFRFELALLEGTLAVRESPRGLA